MGLFKIESEHFDGEVKVIRPASFPDERGSLTVTYIKDELYDFGLQRDFVRLMYTRSKKNVLRGLHFQLKPEMSKLIQVINGSAYLVAVDLRRGSPTFLKYHAVVASGDNKLQVWAPADFARGYCALEDNTVVQYNCDAYVGVDKAVRWNDPAIGIDWPVKNPILSARDRVAQTVEEYLRER